MNDLPHRLDRTLLVRAPRSLVFRYFTDSERFAAWWGAGSRIDPRPGGEVLIRYPNGATAQGEILEMIALELVVFTYGYDRPNTPIAPGASRVTVTFTEVPGGTKVLLRHDVADAATRDAHVAGWRYQMAVFADVVARDQHAGATAIVDGYLAAWSDGDATRRRAALAARCTEDVVYRDRYGFASGLDDLDGHIVAAQLHLPSRLERVGDLRLSAGMALVDWQASKSDGAAVATGTSAIELSPDGRIARVTGFWPAT